MSKQAFKRVRRALGMSIERKPLDAYAWPGGYPIVYLCSDGESICPECANAEIDRVDSEIRQPECHGQFRIVAHDILWEGTAIQCAHCNRDIESAYGPTDD